jgi:hypothetical protein
MRHCVAEECAYMFGDARMGALFTDVLMQPCKAHVHCIISRVSSCINKYSGCFTELHYVHQHLLHNKNSPANAEVHCGVKHSKLESRLEQAQAKLRGAIMALGSGLLANGQSWVPGQATSRVHNLILGNSNSRS